MSLTQAQWYSKLSKFVPGWLFEDRAAAECYTVALFNAIAAVLSQIQSDSDSCFNSTFLTSSTTPVLDLMGAERSVLRNPGESDASYAARIQQIFNSSELSNLQALVNGVLNNGSAQFILNGQYGFHDDAMFCDDTTSRLMDGTKNYNYFTIIVPIQTGGTQAVIQAAIITSIEQNKALGVAYDVLYLSSSDTDGDD